MHLIKIICYPSRDHLVAASLQVSLLGMMYSKNSAMFLYLSDDKTIFEIQHAFSSKYPFLKLEFYNPANAGSSNLQAGRMPGSITLKEAGLKKDGLVDIQNSMSVSTLERILLKEYGLNAHVSRRSGKFWLETNMTDEWTLEKQNEHGREITMPVKEKGDENIEPS